MLATRYEELDGPANDNGDKAHQAFRDGEVAFHRFMRELAMEYDGAAPTTTCILDAYGDIGGGDFYLSFRQGWMSAADHSPHYAYWERLDGEVL